MSATPKSFKNQVLVNSVMTGTSTVTSQITNIKNFDNVFYDIQFSGTPTGTFSVEVSTAYDPLTNPNAIFIPLVLSPVPVASGTSGSIGIDVNQEGAQWIKLVYTNISGTGVLNAWVSGKSL
jgi:hypothetical protein